MFDDVLSAATLIGVASVFAAAVATLGSTPERDSVATEKSTAVAANASGSAASTGSHSGAGPVPRSHSSASPVPIYDLPRVVVRGQRTRDGDVLADVTTPGRNDAAALPER